MAHIDPSTLPVRQGTMTAEAFIADRENFWSGFTKLVTFCAGFVVLLLILMAIFLV